MNAPLPTEDEVGKAAREMLRDLANATGSADRAHVIRILTDALCDVGYSREFAELVAEQSLGKFGDGRTNG